MPSRTIKFIKVPVNWSSSYKDLRLYIRYVDMKAQNDEGLYKIGPNKASERTRYRDMRRLTAKGWASQCVATEDGQISLRSYQQVWRDLGIERCRVGKSGRQAYRYYKIPTDTLSLDRAVYLKEIEAIIQKKVASRKAAQIRWSLKQKGIRSTQANFSAKSAAFLFGYKSASSGSRLRKANFDVIEAPSVPFFNKVKMRYEEPTKQIAL